jgi:pimeloyl-ACP methyl ester carboxylesterase
VAQSERLVFTQSEDGFILEGAVFEAAPADKRPLAVVWTHGLTSKFYQPTTVDIGRELAARGYGFLATNNRGHDFGTMLYSREGKVVLAGSGWEAFDECPRDIAAWIGFALALGYKGVALAGHSLGSLKVAYYLGQRRDPRVAGLIAASVPAKAHQHNPELVGLAEKMVSEGRGQELLPAGASRAGAGTLSAATLVNRVRTGLDVYGFDTPGAAITRVACPILAMYGSKEPMVGGPAELEKIRANATASPRVETFMIEGADHSYYGHTDEVASAIAAWLPTL